MQSAAMEIGEEKIVLPPKYYLDYFNDLLDFVQDKYKHILEHEEWQFLRKFYGLSEGEQCLFIRFSNRKGQFFNLDKIKYEEIESIEEVQKLLFKKEFLLPPAPDSREQREELLNRFTKTQLYPIVKETLPKSTKKEVISKLILENNSLFKEFEKQLITNSIVQVNFQKEVTFLKFLFFGNRYMDMSEFVIRDLGHIYYPYSNGKHLVAQFASREEALDKWQITDQQELFKTLKKTLPALEIHNWMANYLDSKPRISKVAQPSFDQLIIDVGRHLERNKEIELALNIFRYTAVVPSRERQVRCLHKLKNKEEAIALCEEIEANATLADEVFFAKDFKERVLLKSRKNKKLTTAKMHEGESITISSVYRGQVELGTIEHFIEQGKNAIFSENYTWRGVFGLVFWDLIFDPELVSFHHPFQRRPSDLHLPDFYLKREHKIKEHLQQFETKEDLLTFMWETFEENQGKSNPFVIWHEEAWEVSRLLVDRIPLLKLLDILHHISKDISEHSRGFPDLLVWDDESYEFIEVKSPTDNLSNRQLYWLHYFEENGVNASVLRVFFD